MIDQVFVNRNLAWTGFSYFIIPELIDDHLGHPFTLKMLLKNMSYRFFSKYILFITTRMPNII